MRQPAGLWKRNRRVALGRADRLAVDGDALQRGQDRRRRVEHDAVERDPFVVDHPLDLAARGDAGARQQFGDALRLAGPVHPHRLVVDDRRAFGRGGGAGPLARRGGPGRARRRRALGAARTGAAQPRGGAALAARVAAAGGAVAEFGLRALLAMNARAVHPRRARSFLAQRGVGARTTARTFAPPAGGRGARLARIALRPLVGMGPAGPGWPCRAAGFAGFARGSARPRAAAGCFAAPLVARGVRSARLARRPCGCARPTGLGRAAPFAGHARFTRVGLGSALRNWLAGCFGLGIRRFGRLFRAGSLRGASRTGAARSAGRWGLGQGILRIYGRTSGGLKMKYDQTIVACWHRWRGRSLRKHIDHREAGSL